MTARDLSQDEAFRAEVRQFLQDELTPELRADGRRNAGIFSDYGPGNSWHRILAKRGWSVPHWPVEWGGTGWTPMQHYIFASECTLAGAPARAPQGPSMVAPVLLKYGTPEQKERWLPAIRSGEDYWAQGYSEPGSGSDLASLQCRAVRDGDEYVINGTKIWTTHAHFSNRIFCLVRTSTEGKPQQGISFLCFDIDLPGITIRPIPSLSGDHELNQVFFDDVRVPVSALVGEENQGWTVAKYLLVHERSGLRSPSQRVRLERLMARAQLAFGERTDAAAQRAADALWMRIARAAAGVDAMQATDLDALDASVAGQEPPLLPSVGKVLGAQGRQLITSLLVEAGGPAMAASLSQEDAQGRADGLDVPEDAIYGTKAYLNDRAASIYGGSNEVQRGIVWKDLETGGLKPTDVNLLHGQLLGEDQADLRDALVMLDAQVCRLLQVGPGTANQGATVDQLQLGGEPASQPETGGWPLPAWWAQLGELGALSVAWPEAQGGIDAGLLGHGQMMYSLARGVKAQAYLASVVLGGGALLASQQPAHAELLARVGAGQAMVAFAHGEPAAHGDRHLVQTRLVRQGDGSWHLSGRKALVLAAPWASHAVVSARVSGKDHEAAGLALVVVPLKAAGVRQRAFKTIDGACASELAFDNVSVAASDLIGEAGQAAGLIDALLDQATLALSAEVLGLSERMIEDTLAHLRQRTQFGKPLGTFQVLQHRVTEMYNLRALAMAQTRRALRDLPADAGPRAYTASATMLVASQAATEVGEGTVQLHGAMGVTEELAAGHYFRRATVLVQQLGSPDWHAGRVADVLRARV
ncbi:hypothetical protein CCO03_13095 [Comamonas serinivorans]|uniref:Acyl-CoA dehydrogenase n=1 Tax=Comamonas serinivorans TaxID=1082851 RepID=A0A1Y0EPD1_9BURK|nr:acyl-CoA dehydrogenase family protein [Comamonas serinivorans]ARU05495.1 hypothetical protein CCO03_13095 [Comamonas serinivorans]